MLEGAFSCVPALRLFKPCGSTSVATSTCSASDGILSPILGAQCSSATPDETQAGFTDYLVRQSLFLKSRFPYRGSQLRALADWIRGHWTTRRAGDMEVSAQIRDVMRGFGHPLTSASHRPTLPPWKWRSRKAPLNGNQSRKARQVSSEQPRAAGQGRSL